VLTNNGASGLGLTAAPAVSGHASFGTDLTTCGAALAAGQSCLTDVLFSPTAEGSTSGTLQFATGLAGVPGDVQLQGTGYNPVSLSAGAIPRGMQGIAYPAFDFASRLVVRNET